jgi:ankyrin repeat protein
MLRLLLFIFFSVLILLELVTFANSQRSVSKSYGPPAFFLQDPNDGLCLAGGLYKRCSLSSLWYIQGKPGFYQIHHRLTDDEEDDICLSKMECHLDESSIDITDCGHCGTKKWNILGDSTTGFVLTQDKNKFCIKRSDEPGTGSTGKSSTGEKDKEKNKAEIIKCDKGYSSFNLVLVTKEDLTVMGSDNSKFINAVLDHNKVEVEDFLTSKKLDINVRDWDNTTALIAASSAGYLDTVQYLLSHGADLHLVDKDNVTALMEAARGGFFDILKLLHKEGAELELSASSGVTALWLAAGEGHTDIVEYLLQHKVDPNNARSDGITALMAAANGGFVSVVDRLIKAGASVNNQDKEGLTALINAVENGTVPLIKLLIEAGSDVNVMTETGFTPLIIAAGHGYTEVVDLLLTSGADIEGNNHPEGVTPLMYASAGGHYETVKLLLERGASVTSRHKQGGTALMESVTLGNSSIVNLLLNTGSDPLIVDNDGITLLMSAASQGHTDICRVLIEKGVDINAIGNSGGTALMFAVGQGHYNTSKLLIEKGADVNIVVEATTEYIEQNAKDIAEGTKEDIEPHKDGITALMLASQNGYLSLVKLLLEAGADATLADEEEMTALVYAIKGKYIDIALLLLEKGEGVNPDDVYYDQPTGSSSSTSSGSTESTGSSSLPLKEHNLLMDSLLNSHVNLSIALIRKGANISYTDDDGVTPLIQASYLGLEDVVSAILDRVNQGDDEMKSIVSMSNSEGVNALIAASSEGYLNIVKMLLATKVCDINAKDKDGTNALMAASVRGHWKVVEELIKGGIDINSQNIDGHTALMFAYNGKNQVETLLDKYSEYMKDLTEKDRENNNSTQLINEALEAHRQVIKLLIDNGADTQIKDNEGHIAVDFDYRQPETISSPSPHEDSVNTDETIVNLDKTEL